MTIIDGCPHTPAHEHGTTAGYQTCRCRCSACGRAAVRANKRRAWIRNNSDPRPAAVRHVAKLLARGVTATEISETSGVSRAAIRKINRLGRVVKIDTAVRLLSVAPPVTTVGIARRVQALVALGWTQREIARRLGWTSTRLSNLVLQPRLWLLDDGASDVLRVYDELQYHRPPATQGTLHALTVARRHGWAPPLAWDDIDDPDEQPSGLRGDRTHGETRAEILDLASLGYDRDEIAHRLGITRDAVNQSLRRAAA